MVLCSLLLSKKKSLSSLYSHPLALGCDVSVSSEPDEISLAE